jgi:acyl phosphate:glycerol-3-phosphate acyltransferase
MNWLIAIAAYLLGSLPFSYGLARLAGRDIYRLGDGNVGAHNVMRHVGRGWGWLALLLDAAKGALAVVIANAWSDGGWLPVAAGVVAVLGHNYPILLRGRGGKGLATSLGVVLALFPALIWLIALLTIGFVAWSRNLAFSGVALGIILAITAAMLGYPLPSVVAPLALLLVMALRQWPDLRRDWQQTPDKRDLLLNRWIRDREAEL